MPRSHDHLGPRSPSPPCRPPLPEGVQVSYHCDDGNALEVTYTHVVATLRWADGRTVQLTRAASAPADSDDVYAGDDLSLGGSIQLRHDSRPPARCTEASATA